MKNILYYVIPPIVGTIVAMPYYYIGYFTNSSYTSAGINSLKEKLATLPFVVSFSGFPWIITALFILGVLLFLGKYKNYKKPLIFLIYYFILLFIGPLVAPSGIATYLLRLWSTLPYIVLPIAAYGMYFIINFVSKTSGFKREYLTLILLIVILIPGLTQANNISEGLKGEHVTKEKYYALQWIQDNTGEEDLIFMLEGSYQGEAVYTKRLTYAVPITELQNQVNSAFTNQEVSFIFEQEWSDVGRWSKWRYKTGYLSYDAYEPLNQTQDIREFDYVFMHHLNEQVKTYNDVMVQVLTENLNWEKVYDTNGFVILKNE